MIEKLVVRLLITSAVVFFHSHVVFAQSPLTDDQKIDYCTGVAASQIAIISTLLRDDGSTLSLPQIKTSSISEATKMENISDITRMGIVAHTNGFEEKHITQMKRELQRAMRQRKLDLSAYRDLFNESIPALMVEKYKGCISEVR